MRWPDIRDRVFGRIDLIAAGGSGGWDYRVTGPNTTAFLGHASFIKPRTLRIDTGDDTGVEIAADQIVIAARAHPAVPDAVAESGEPFHTSDTVMRLGELPRRLVILGSGFIALDHRHVPSAVFTTRRLSASG